MIKNNLGRILGERKIKVSELARMIECDYCAVNRLYNGNTPFVNLSLLDKICCELNVDVCDILEYVPNINKISN